MNIFAVLALLSSTQAINVKTKTATATAASASTATTAKATVKVAARDYDWNVGGNYTQQLDNNIT
jgi:hypothetical protein